ncbi:hypothetical protein [Fibrobacter sp. HC4]|uniref:hypothetical protein n=1 Tax=Fibrobacter sp. HC4 TaxID=3239812 RepID=UPI0020190F32|nr:hypothetical protein [Fibrobacter succinogenes]MCL4103417.1 hypothetical protein [Fibrobacter succinogenes]
MTLLVTVFAAIICTALWYRDIENKMHLSPLCYMYWGASLMWFVDAIFEYAELRAEFFTPAAGDMLNDAFLGFSAVAFGLVIWLAMLLIKDPKGRFHKVA